MCKDVVIEMELIQSHVENALQQDLKLESGLQHALDVLINEKYENVEMPCHFNIKSIVAYVEVGISRNFKSTLVNQLNGNPTLSEV